jgi:sporulation protein YlmC with PRC-barrel domain
VDLVRDMLDTKVVDRNGRELGRVDSVVLVIPDGGLPRVSAIEIGPAVLARRLSSRLGRWVEGLEHAFGVDEGRPLRIPLDRVIAIDDAIKVDMTFSESPTSTIELFLRQWIRRLPGS